MGIFSGLFRSRDKPKDSYDSPSYSYFFGRTHAGKRVNDRTAMQIIAVYACVRVLSEAIAQLPLHVYQYTDNGKERVPKHPLYFLLHDQPNPEMTSFVFRETLMAHLLIYGNAYAQIIRNGRGDVIGLYPLMPDKDKVSAIMRAFLERVEAAGYFVGLYGSASSLTTHTADDIKSWYTIWLAHWVDQTNYRGAYGVWQHSEKGKFAGINGNVDLDICYKDFPTIIKGKGLNGYGKEKALTNPPAPVSDDGISVEITVDGKKYSGKLNKA